MVKRVLLGLLLSIPILHTAVASDYQNATEDRQAIAGLIAEYAFRWDKKDAAGVAALFSDDGTIDWVLGDKPEATVVKGKENIAAYARQAHSERLAGKQSRHHFTNIIFLELDSAKAVTEHMMFVTHQVPGSAPENVATGYYRIAWKKHDNQWLMTHRTLFLDR
ncbi:MAG: nuclear transport factor 2 family protein [Pseudomonadota bacterium]